MAAPMVFEVDTGTNGTFRVMFRYTKNDDRVVVLELLLYHGDTPVGRTTIDVSGQAVGETRTYTASMPNGTSKTTVNAADKQVITLQPGESRGYTAPSGYKAAVMAGSAGVDVVVNGNDYPFSNDVILAPGQSITLVNRQSTQADVTVYLINDADLPLNEYTLYVMENDNQGAKLYRHQFTVYDVPPVTIQYEEQPPPSQPITQEEPVEVVVEQGGASS